MRGCRTSVYPLAKNFNLLTKNLQFATYAAVKTLQLYADTLKLVVNALVEALQLLVEFPDLATGSPDLPENVGKSMTKERSKRQ